MFIKFVAHRLLFFEIFYTQDFRILNFFWFRHSPLCSYAKQAKRLIQSYLQSQFLLVKKETKERSQSFIDQFQSLSLISTEMAQIFHLCLFCFPKLQQSIKMESESKRIDREQLKLQMQSWRYAKDTESTTLRSSQLLLCPASIESMDELRSPTFLNESYVIEQESDLEKIIFKFGQALRQQMKTLVESKKVNQKLEHIQFTSSVPFESFCKSSSENMFDRSKVVDIFQKFSKFYEDTKLLFDMVRGNLKDYQSYLKAQQGYLTNFLKITLKNIQIRQAQKTLSIQKDMEQLRKQNFVYVEKIKYLEEKSQSLKQNLIEVIRISTTEKLTCQKSNKKISQLNEELQKKNCQIFNLLEENKKSYDQLKKVVCLFNSANKGGNKTSCCHQETYTFKPNLNLNKVINNGERSANFKQSESTAWKYEVSSSRGGSPRLNTEQNDINIPFMRKLSATNLASNSTILQQKNSKGNLLSPKSKNEQKFRQEAKMQRKLASPNRYSWQTNPQIEETRCKQGIMQRIRNLKDHLNNQIKELKYQKY